jgi:hypothetical protein
MKNGAFLQLIYKQSATQLEELDTIRVERDGRKYAYAQAGAVALAAGKLTQSAIPSANANKETLNTSASIGATSVTISCGGTFIADYYKDGYLWINDDVGEGHLYDVKSHAALVASTGNIIYLKQPLRVAITAGASTVTMLQNRQALVLVCPTTITGAVTGVPPIAVDINYYFWNQVKGPATVLMHTGSGGAAAIGTPVCPATTNTPVAGAVEEMEASFLLPHVGDVMAVNATTEYALINLDIKGY